MKQNILIVEDHELTRFGLKTTFEGVDYVENIYEADSAEAAIEIFTKDCAKTIKFFQKDCTYEEFYWVSEIFEEIAEKTQSKELISTWRSRLAVVRPESYCKQNFHSKEMQHVDYSEYVRSIEQEINYAEGRIIEWLLSMSCTF